MTHADVSRLLAFPSAVHSKRPLHGAARVAAAAAARRGRPGGATATGRRWRRPATPWPIPLTAACRCARACGLVWRALRCVASVSVILMPPFLPHKRFVSRTCPPPRAHAPPSALIHDFLCTDLCHPPQAISANLRGPALRQAEELLRGAADTPLAATLVGAVEDARGDSRGQGAEAAAQVRRRS